MTFIGQVKNGVVVLEEPSALPDGTKVTVRPIRSKPKSGKRTRRYSKTRGEIMKFAGKAKGLPSDAARNLDHYLYGHPKR